MTVLRRFGPSAAALAIAFTTRYSGMDATLGLAFTQTGYLYPLFAALLGWLKGFQSPPRRTFVVHGEAETACGFADRVADELGWSVEAPAPGTRVDL